MIDQGLNTHTHVRILISMSTYKDRLDSHRRRECASEWSASAYLRRGTTALTMCHYERRAAAGWDESPRYAVGLEQKIRIVVVLFVASADAFSFRRLVQHLALSLFRHVYDGR